MKKAAILLTGLVRTYKKTFANFYSNLINTNTPSYEIDIFLTFWDHTHQRGKLGYTTEKRKLCKKEIEEIVSMYKPKSFKLLRNYEEQSKKFKKKSHEIADKIGTPRHPDGNVLIENGVLAQTYVWKQAFGLIENSYDVVVKTRFDAASQKIDFDEIIEKKFNCSGPSHQFSQYKLADVIFSSDYKTMKKIMVDYHDLAASNNLPVPKSGYKNIFQEFILKEFLQQTKIDINYINKKVHIIR